MALADQYCHHHRAQNRTSTQTITPKPGYIYVYTYRNLYDSLAAGHRSKLPWLLIDDSVLSPTNTIRRPWDSHSHILCKIGMTTKSKVSTRLLEWENSCKHPVLNLTPDRVATLCSRNSATGLSRLLSKLFLTPSKPTITTKNLQTYHNGGFWVPTGELPAIEHAIHRHLWQRYGQGLIYCHGCDPSGKKRHREWFRVPVCDLPWLLTTLDRFCQGLIR